VGAALDFLQKYLADSAMSALFIRTGFLFSERVLYDYCINFFNDYVLCFTYARSAFAAAQLLVLFFFAGNGVLLLTQF